MKIRLQKKCLELNAINTQIIQELDDTKKNNDSLRNIIDTKQNILKDTKQFFLERNQKSKRNRHIQEQLEIFFIENPDFYINKKKLECFENFIHFVFCSIHNLLSTNAQNASISNLGQSKEQQSNILRIKEFIETANSDMLMYHFKDLVENEKKALLRKYNTLKEFLMQIVHSQQNSQNISPYEVQKYNEYIDLYADTNQIQQIRTLIFDEYNQINLRKSKRSPCKIVPRNTLGDKNLNYLNMIDSYQVKSAYCDEERTYYDNQFANGKKKVKTNDQQN